MWPFFNPTIKVVTFRLRGWCVLGVFLLSAFTRQGHERQDLLSPCDEMHVCTDWTSVYTLIRTSIGGNGVWTHVNSKGKIPSTENVPRGGSNPRRCGQRAQALPTELFRPRVWSIQAKHHSQNDHFCWLKEKTEKKRGRNSSVGSVLGPLYVLRDEALWVRSSSGLPAEGIFPLEITWALTPFPQNSFGWEFKPRSSLCINAFHCKNSKDPDIHALHRWMPVTKTHPACTIHEDGMWLPQWLD